MSMSLVSPQGFRSSSTLTIASLGSSSLFTFDPPQVPANFDTSSGDSLPSTAWNTSAATLSWDDWSINANTSRSAVWAYCETPNCSISYAFVGNEYFLMGSFSGMEDKVQNNTLELTIDGHTVESADYGKDGGAGQGIAIEGFGYNYGSMLPGSFGFVGGLNNTLHNITVKLKQGWINATEYETEMYSGAYGAHTNISLIPFYKVNDDHNAPRELDPSIMSKGNWTINKDGVAFTEEPGSTIAFNLPENATTLQLLGYTGPEGGNYTVELQNISHKKDQNGTISWYGMAPEGYPAKQTFSAKRQWPVNDTIIYQATVDQSQPYNLVVTFTGQQGEKFGMGYPFIYAQTGQPTKDGGARAGAGQVGLVTIVLVALVSALMGVAL